MTLYIRHSITWFVLDENEVHRTWDAVHELKRALNNLGWDFTEEIAEVKYRDDENDFAEMLAQGGSDDGDTSSDVDSPDSAFLPHRSEVLQ